MTLPRAVLLNTTTRAAILPLFTQVSTVEYFSDSDVSAHFKMGFTPTSGHF
jgi:hypothetical protein